jgi:hypothetical protein
MNGFVNRLLFVSSLISLQVLSGAGMHPAQGQEAAPEIPSFGASAAYAPVVPYVDKYGQKISADWPGKITSDSQLKQSAVDEAKKLDIWDKAAVSNDNFGAYHAAGWHVAGTGYYRPLQHNGIWWLITPNGYPCFYKGLTNAPALIWETTPVTGREGIFADLPDKNGPFAAAWHGDAWGVDPGIQSFAFCSANLMRKYGADWKNSFRNVTTHRVKAWGFSGFGKWGDFVPAVPTIVVLNRTGVPTPDGIYHPDPFDPATQSKLKDVLSAQITPHLTDPYLVAWSVGNEGAEIIQIDEIEAILVGPDSVPAKRAMVDYAIDTIYQGNVEKTAAAWGDTADHPATRASLYVFVPSYMPSIDIESLREFYSDKYYQLIYKTVKSIDHHHIYAGFWVVEGFTVDEPDWDLIAKNCDVVGFDLYDFDFSKHGSDSLFASTGKPVLCGEFSFPQSLPSRGYSDFGVLSLKDETASGEAYAHFASTAAKNPYCIGICWFQYRDQPITGRGPGFGPDLIYGENYPFGLVDITDNPKWTLLNVIHDTNITLSKVHAGAR